MEIIELSFYVMGTKFNRQKEKHATPINLLLFKNPDFTGINNS